jgi:hypothetical protein
MDEQETTISQVMAMASDPDVKAIVICQGVPGTAAAIDKVKEVRDDILFVIGTVHEEPYMMAGKADILFEIDQPTRGTSIVEKAKEMGAKTFIHYSFPRHMSYPLLAKRREIMEETCKKIGLEFVFVNAPDPTGEGGVAGSQQFILEDAPRQVEKYGPDTAFFSTNCSMQEPLIKSVVKTKAIYPEQCCPSPFHALPNALGLKVENKGDVPYILKAIEEKVAELGMQGRIATWTAPITMNFIRAGAEYAMDFANGKFEDKKDIQRAKFTREGCRCNPHPRFRRREGSELPHGCGRIHHFREEVSLSRERRDSRQGCHQGQPCLFDKGGRVIDRSSPS